MFFWETPRFNLMNFLPAGLNGSRHFFASLIVAQILFAGCQHKRETASESPRLETGPSPSETRVIERNQTAVMSNSPIRRSAETLSNLLEDERAQAILDTIDTSPLVTSTSTDTGLLIVKAMGLRGESKCKKLLEAAGFKADGGEVWTKRLNIGERRNFEGRLAQWLGEDQKSETDARERLQKARTPSALFPAGPKNPNQQWLSGKLVYTGQAMDIACADAGDAPRTFIEVLNAEGSSVAFVRGGRLYLDAEGSLRIDKYKLPGEWRPLPEGTEQIAVQPDGKVSAIKADATRIPIGELRLRRIGKVVAAGEAFAAAPGETIGAANGESLRPGHLEYPAINLNAEYEQLGQLLAARRLIDALGVALSHPVIQAPVAPGTPPVNTEDFIVVHADLVLTEQHLKALNIPMERTPGRTTITVNGDVPHLSAALAKTLQVLRLRMSVHEQNWRNAERIRDADNRINPYRRKMIKIGPQGEAVEEPDSSPFPKTYKPGDPNADGEGFVTMPNVNRAVETAEFQAAAAEYRLVRAALERVAPYQIFPDPIALPQKVEGQ
jgi:flagellar basal body rod protein FlgC